MKLIIADDEPLVQVGINSMIDWSSLDIEVCGIAKNGNEAYELIKKFQPDIIISDIKMPAMSGLELLQKCNEEFKGLPVFIMLTSYEDFKYARMALKYQASDYLIKLELTTEDLKSAIIKAKNRVNELRSYEVENTSQNSQLNVFLNRFYLRLINNLFESDEIFQQQQADFKIDFNATSYTVASIKIVADLSAQTHNDNAFTLYNSTVQMFEQLIQKYSSCFVLSLDLRCFVVVFHVDELHSTDIEYIKNALKQTASLLHNYYNVTLYTSIGRFVTNPQQISESYNDAKQISIYTTAQQPILYINEIGDHEYNAKNIFNLAIFKYDIVKTFENFDILSLNKINDTIFHLFKSDTLHYAQAVDIVGSMLHFAITLLPNGTDVVESIFKDESDNYLSLYRYKSVQQVLTYLNKLRDGLHTFFEEKQDNLKNQLMIQVKKYINDHICEKLSLQGIAEIFNISQNYLSQLFKQYYKIGFNEYITKEKIEYAKHMLSNNKIKIYEVAEQLGYENAFYFSKVFKKVVGLSPTEYLSNLTDHN